MRVPVASAVVDTAIEKFGKITALVNSAYAHPGFFDLLETPDKGLRRSFDVIVHGALNMTRLAVPHMKAAGHGSIVNVGTMTTRKPPNGLEGAPYLVQNRISLVGLAEEKEVFCGSAREACKGFPANVNVSAAVSLAGIGPDRTRIRILAVPGLLRNCHDIEIEGEFGRLHIHIENIPSENPKTGKLTALSIIRSVQDVVDPVRIGT